MPKVDDLRSILAAATSPDEITFVYDNLSSPEWIPALRELGALREPPAAISRQDHIEFPDWPVSRYLARMAPKDSARVAEALQEIGDTDNIRVWRNILDALLTMPGRYSTPFLTRIGSWIHGPYQRALDSVAGDLGKKLIDESLVDQALALLRSLAMLTAPEHWPADTPWQPISDYVYGTDVPALAAALAGNTRGARRAGRRGGALARIWRRRFRARCVLQHLATCD